MTKKSKKRHQKKVESKKKRKVESLQQQAKTFIEEEAKPELVTKDEDADIEEISDELEAGLNQEGLTLEPEGEFDAGSLIDDILKEHGA